MPDSALSRRTEGAGGIAAAVALGAWDAGVVAAFGVGAAFSGSADLLAGAREGAP
jgi:hypothetical protein